MNCANCRNSKQRLHFLGWRLYCRLYQRHVNAGGNCINWRRA